MWQRPFVLEHLSKIATINPPATGRTADKMLGLIRGRLSNALANVFPAREVHAFIAPISSPPRAIPIPQQQPGLHPPPQVIAAWSKLMPRPVTALPERGNETVFVKRWPPSLQSNGPKCFVSASPICIPALAAALTGPP
jgi:hypothetical protein